MIDFTCPGCGRRFNVRDENAGRKARCKQCGIELTVPAAPVPAPAGPPRLSPRHRRLMADHSQMVMAFSNNPTIRICRTQGDPPEIYEIEYFVDGLELGDGGTPVIRKEHAVAIQLTSEYPRVSPKCRMLSPIFHPNIDPTTICIGDHWTAGERLVDLVVRIGEMIAYQSYNIRSPLDGEAAAWADLHAAELPVDKRPILAGE